ncbi:UNVERIFIED_CONTAM: hypothetical protein Scaly_1483800 [Sesamum calycinum]|uniref:Tf2-1-like SH3-like domain-containing protein n=1 Tax=Sesamum calycinum TaxID=2727403 RepID=A0AAW2PTV1_9LAMI
MQKYVGPLPIIKRIGTVAYKIELPSWWKIHSVFHVSQLKKYSADKEDDARNQPSRPQLELTKTKEKVAEAILNHRVTSTAKRTHIEYLVKWKGCRARRTLGAGDEPQGLSTACRSLPCFPCAEDVAISGGGECQGTPALSAPLTHIRPRNRSTRPTNNLRRQTLDFRSLRVLGLFNEIHISNPCAIYCFATAPCLNLLLLLHTVLLFLSARYASVGGYSVVLLLGGSSRLLRTASHTMPLPPHCGKRLVRPGDAVPGHVLENRELIDSVLAAAAEQPRRAL